MRPCDDFIAVMQKTENNHERNNGCNDTDGEHKDPQPKVSSGIMLKSLIPVDSNLHRYGRKHCRKEGNDRGKK